MCFYYITRKQDRFAFGQSTQLLKDQGTAICLFPVTSRNGLHPNSDGLMASNLRAMASTLMAMASNRVASCTAIYHMSRFDSHYILRGACGNASSSMCISNELK